MLFRNSTDKPIIAVVETVFESLETVVLDKESLVLLFKSLKSYDALLSLLISFLISVEYSGALSIP